MFCKLSSYKLEISEECAHSVALQYASDAFRLGIFAAVLSFANKLLLLGENRSVNTKLIEYVAWLCMVA